jgi:cytidylate kinase
MPSTKNIKKFLINFVINDMLPKIITISGLPGCGKSTTAKLLAEKLSYEYLDTGVVFRNLAKKHNMTLHEFEEYSNQHHEIDKELDQAIIEQIKNSPGVVLQGRLAGWMCLSNQVSAFKIWLYLPLEIRSNRISERENISLEEATSDILFRENSITKRYKEIYNIDYSDLSIYDLKFETTPPPNIIVEQILEIISKPA